MHPDVCTSANHNQPHLFFASLIDRPLMFCNHENCTPLRCLAGQTDEESYRPAHVHPDCQCAHVSVDAHALAAVLKRNLTPKIPISEDIVPHIVEDGAYVTISHFCKSAESWWWW
jgi:hypothetical protein